MLKDKVLEYLILSNDYISGEALSSRFDVSRNTIWKVINSLREDGYIIKAVTNKGYLLENRLFSKVGIKEYLSYDIDLDVLDSVTSTNDLLMSQAHSLKHLKVIVAKEQTKGKGRKGRSFYSPDSSGAYLSILLKPKSHILESIHITVLSAVAVCLALEDVASCSPYIKWVNDIFIDNKKVCGILTEASIDMETGGVEHIVVGIGINIFQPKNNFPNELENIAGSVFNSSNINFNITNQLVGQIINNFIKLYNDMDKQSLHQYYKAHSFILGKEITLNYNNKQEQVIALDIDEDFRLVIEHKDGYQESILSGEVSIIL